MTIKNMNNKLMWVVFDPNNEIVYSTLRECERFSINAAVKVYNNYKKNDSTLIQKMWEEMKTMGFKTQQIEMTYEKVVDKE